MTEPSDFDPPFKNHSVTHRFFRFLLKNPILKEAEASRRFFDTPPGDLSFRRTKRKLQEQLVQALFFIDHKKLGTSRHQRAYYYCWRQLCAAKILLGQSAHHAAIDLVKKILKRAKKHEFTFLAMECCQLLRWYYACMDGQITQYKKYDQLLVQYRKIYSLEQQAEDYYTQIAGIYLTDKGQRYFLAEKARQYWREMKKKMAVCSSSRLHFLGHLIHVYTFSCAGNYPAAVQANQEAVDYFQPLQYIPDSYLRTFQNHQLACYIKLKQFEAGQALACKLDKQIKTGSFDWFVNRNLYFLLCMHTGHYRQAGAIYKNTIRHRRFRHLSEAQAEKWRINGAYLYFLQLKGTLDQATGLGKKFKLQRFLRQIPLYAKDKRGMNVPILMVQVLILLAQKRYNKVIERLEAMDKYRGRYLRLEDGYRSNCFIQMLTTLPEAGFHHKAVERKARQYKEKLDRTPLEVSPQAYELEIIPYEKLWEMVMELLEVG